MEKLVRYIKFPFQFDENRLKKDIEKIINNQWIDHYNTNDYEGKWTSVALLSTTGKSDSIYAFPNDNQKVVPTELLVNCHYINEILEGFLFEKTAVRLLRLAINAEVKPHSDHCLGYEDGCFRLHIPIITNPDVTFVLDNQQLIMNEGECWYINANFTHSVSNKGKNDRIHLVIDGVRNELTDFLFFENHDENQFQKPIPVLDENTKKLMIEQLKLMNTDAALEIIKNLEA